ncbi:hypothetical protein ACPYPG_08250 [Streptomyces sp. FR-108]|uniref:hypothetical protein n=1 Tax=Streptomyces sp. FR-108 TaxID=3416665 RepID=UPI003CF4C559
MSEQNNSDSVEDVTDANSTSSETEWTPPTREEWENLLDKKKTADAEAASRKRFLRDLGYDPKTGEKLSADLGTEGEGDVQSDAAKPVQVDAAAIEKAASEKSTALVIALAEAGVGPKSLKYVSKLIDPAENILPQIEALKAEVPDLFKRSRNTPVADATAVGAGSKQTPSADQSKTYAQRLAESIYKG